MNKTNLAGREPVALRTTLVAAATALIHLLVLLGVVDLSPDTEAALVTTVDLIAAAAIVILVRPKVTPIAAPTVPEGSLNGLIVTEKDGQPVPRYTITPHGYDASEVAQENTRPADPIPEDRGIPNGTGEHRAL